MAADGGVRTAEHRYKSRRTRPSCSVQIASCPLPCSGSPNCPLPSPAVAGHIHRYLVQATSFDRRATAHLALRQLATFAEIGSDEAATAKDSWGTV